MARQSRPILLLTRPATASARFARQIRETLGCDPALVISPLIAPRFLSPDPPEALKSGRARGLVFTSETGVEGFARISAERNLPAFCVGPQTAAAAAGAGFMALAVGGDAETMLAGLVERGPATPLIHARGVAARGDLAARLSAAGIETQEFVVYDQCEQPLTPEASAILAGSVPVLVPLFSPRSASLFVRHAADARAPLLLAAISAAAAAPLSGLGALRIEIAPGPDAEGMLAAVAALCRDRPAS